MSLARFFLDCMIEANDAQEVKILDQTRVLIARFTLER
jgi:hypothetical protein